MKYYIYKTIHIKRAINVFIIVYITTVVLFLMNKNCLVNLWNMQIICFEAVIQSTYRYI